MRQRKASQILCLGLELEFLEEAYSPLLVIPTYIITDVIDPFRLFRLTVIMLILSF